MKEKKLKSNLKKISAIVLAFLMLLGSLISPVTLPKVKAEEETVKLWRSSYSDTEGSSVFRTDKFEQAICEHPVLEAPINPGESQIYKLSQLQKVNDSKILKMVYYIDDYVAYDRETFAYWGLNSTGELVESPGTSKSFNDILQNYPKSAAYHLLHFFLGINNGSSDYYRGLYDRYMDFLSGKPNPKDNEIVMYRLKGGSGVQDMLFWKKAPQNGNLKLIKSSAKPEISDGNNCYSLEGTEYTVYKEKSLKTKVGVLTVKKDGSSNTLSDLPAGTYYVKETKAGKGYALDTKTHSVEVKPEETATLEVKDMPQDDPIAILLRKKDATTGKDNPQGSAKLEGAEFTVKFFAGEYAENVNPENNGISPTKTWVLRTGSKGLTSLKSSSLISGDEFYLDEDGIATLPLGTVTIQETKAPEGYEINNEIFIRKITSEGHAQSVSTYNAPTVPEQVILGKFKLRKVMTDGAASEITEPEKGAEFIAISEKYIKEYGSFEEALKHTDEYGKNEWSKLVTDKDGNAESKELAYGKYIIKQTKGNSETAFLKEEFSVNITGEEVKEFTINNVPNKYLVKIIKKDSVTGETVVLTGAYFKIKDESGKYVTMKIGSKTYDTFVTSAEKKSEIGKGEFYVDTENKGTAVTPLSLKAGKYTLHEVKSPQGYIISDKPIEFTIGKEYVKEKDSDNDEYITVEAENVPQYGKLTVNKTGEVFKNWEDVKVDLPVQGEAKVITEEKEIPRSNENLTLTVTRTEMKKVTELVEHPEEKDETGKVIKEAYSETVEKEIPEEFVETREITTGEDGSFEASDINKESKVTLKDKDDNDVIFDDSLLKTEGKIFGKLAPEIIKEEKVIPGEVSNKEFVYKKAVFEEENLSGAKFSLTAKEDIKSFDGKTVFFNAGEKLPIAMKDITDESGKLVYSRGDVITRPVLSDEEMKDGETVSYTFETGAGGVTISNIPLGTYELMETEAPKGYVKDEKVREYTFTPQESDILVDIQNTENIINKRQKLNVNITKELLDNEYFKNKDYSNIVIGLFTKDEVLGLEKDILVGAASPDENGELSFKDLPEGSYYVKEISTNNGYILSESEVGITISSDEHAETEDKVIKSENIKNAPDVVEVYKIIKLDKITGKPLKNVSFKLYRIKGEEKTLIKNPETGEEVFITNENGEITLKNLPIGNYFLEEVKAADGYIKENHNVTIAVSKETKNEITVKNEPTRTSFQKIDSKTGKPVVGAKLKLTDENGNNIYIDSNNYVVGKALGRVAEWISGLNPFTIYGLSVDKVYKVLELEAPKDYKKGDAVEFKVSNTRGNQLVNIPNAPYESKIKTKAFFEDGEKTSEAYGKKKIYDVVSFFDLIPGKEYIVKAKLVYPEDPTHVVAEAELKFTPETKDGEIKVYFGEIDLSEYAGRKLVVLEKVFDLETMLEVANHEKPTDEDQTVTIKPKKNPEPKKIEKAPKTGDAGVRRLALINVLSAVLYFSAKRRDAIKNK